ncbi:nuclear transport factor 2 family protein [Longibacter sp.]|uniref:nuclear transport factor 2 family protein n=1 Tax=Longibacter sp. TaxID=2045415 RepID=UPI003EC0B7D5
MSNRRPFLLASMILLSGLLLTPTAVAQTQADSAAVRQAARDYIEGYYTADAERMERAVHPALKKRMVYTHPKTGADSLNRQDARALITGTRQRSPTPDDQRRAEVRILDIYKDAASVRIDAQRWVDYLQVAKWQGEWKIVNVLWELRQQPTASR